MWRRRGNGSLGSAGRTRISICGAHPPINEAAAAALVRADRQPSRLHNNCSGKHLGFLTLAMHVGAPLQAYGHPDHPVQRWCVACSPRWAERTLSSAPVAGDGCGVPVIGMPLAAIARGFARLARPAELPVERADAVRRVVSAMTAHPHLVGGTDRFDTLVLASGSGAVVVKGGAEGVCAASHSQAGHGHCFEDRRWREARG